MEESISPPAFSSGINWFIHFYHVQKQFSCLQSVQVYNFLSVSTFINYVPVLKYYILPQP